MALENTETSSSSASTCTKAFFSTAPPTLKRSTASKVQYLFEIDYVPINQKIQETKLADINIYKAVTKPSTSFFKSVKTFLTPSPQKPKEDIHVTEFYEHPIPSGEGEHFITLQIPPEFQRQWISEGYDEVHFGAIRLALTFHNRKGLPLATRIALLDSRYKKYQHACLGIVETTLNAGKVFVTLFPNFTRSVRDKNLSKPFLVQIQIVGASMDPGLIQATLHSQIAYRAQDHVLGLASPSFGDTPLIQVDSKNRCTIILIPTNISGEELVSILPEGWVTNYENRPIEERPTPTQTINPFTRNADGTVTVRFSRSN